MLVGIIFRETENPQVLLALWGTNHWGIVVSVSQEYPPPLLPLFHNNQNRKLRTLCNASLNRLAFPLSSSPWSMMRFPRTQQQGHSVIGQDILLHGKTLFVVPTTDSDHMTLPLFTQSISGFFSAHTLLTEHTKLVCVHHPLQWVSDTWEKIASSWMANL